MAASIVPYGAAKTEPAARCKKGSTKPRITATGGLSAGVKVYAKSRSTTSPLPEAMQTEAKAPKTPFVVLASAA